MPTAVQGRSFRWGMAGSAAVIFMILKITWSKRSISEKQGRETAQMYIWRMCEALRVLLDSQFQLSWGTGQTQAFFILISVVFNAPCGVLLLTVLRPTIPWCVGCNSSTGLAATKLGDILVSLHDDFAAQLSIILSLVGFQGWATETFGIVTSVSFPE